MGTRYASSRAVATRWRFGALATSDSRALPRSRTPGSSAVEPELQYQYAYCRAAIPARRLQVLHGQRAVAGAGCASGAACGWRQQRPAGILGRSGLPRRIPGSGTAAGTGPRCRGRRAGGAALPGCSSAPRSRTARPEPKPVRSPSGRSGTFQGCKRRSRRGQLTLSVISSDESRSGIHPDGRGPRKLPDVPGSTQINRVADPGLQRHAGGNGVRTTLRPTSSVIAACAERRKREEKGKKRKRINERHGNAFFYCRRWVSQPLQLPLERRGAGRPRPFADAGTGFGARSGSVAHSGRDRPKSSSPRPYRPFPTTCSRGSGAGGVRKSGREQHHALVSRATRTASSSASRWTSSKKLAADLGVKASRVPVREQAIADLLAGRFDIGLQPDVDHPRGALLVDFKQSVVVSSVELVAEQTQDRHPEEPQPTSTRPTSRSAAQGHRDGRPRP